MMIGTWIWHFLNLHGWPKRLGQSNFSLCTKAQEKINFKGTFQSCLQSQFWACHVKYP